MTNRLMTGLLLLGLLLLSSNICAQKPGWKKEITKDGRVTVSYKFSEHVDQSGKKYNVLEYEALTAAALKLKSCKAVMMDDSKHMEFMEGTEGTRRIQDISESEWITYYFLNGRWPMPDSDVVTRFVLEEEPAGKYFIMTGTPAPDMYPDQGVARMKHNQTKYTFTDKGNGTVELLMYSKSIPLVSVPKWLISAWIPNGPADMLNGIIDLAGKSAY